MKNVIHLAAEEAAYIRRGLQTSLELIEAIEKAGFRIDEWELQNRSMRSIQVAIELLTEPTATSEPAETVPAREGE